MFNPPLIQLIKKKKCYLQMRQIQEFQGLLHEADDEEAHPSSPGRAGNAAPPNPRNAGDRAIVHFLFLEPMLCVTHHFLEPHSCFHSSGVKMNSSCFALFCLYVNKRRRHNEGPFFLQGYGRISVQMRLLTLFVYLGRSPLFSEFQCYTGSFDSQWF